jgi:hypothetical protein
MLEPNTSKRSYRYLDSNEVTKTVKQLHERILQRFPESGLLKVATELVEISIQAEERSDLLGKPIWLIRVVNLLLVFVLFLFIFYGFNSVEISFSKFSVLDIIQTLEAATSEIIVIGAGIFFLFGLETKIKRSKGLSALHELRAMAHIIDMHQLTKDPSKLDKKKSILTVASPVLKLDAFQLIRYLDYCSEMLAIQGKIAAVYAQDFADPVLLSAVDEIETLTTSLSRKIWQKIVIVHNIIDKNV